MLFKCGRYYVHAKASSMTCHPPTFDEGTGISFGFIITKLLLSYGGKS